MKRGQRFRWAQVFAVAGLLGCGSSNSAGDASATGDGAVACFPECRAGNVCSPTGTCVSACNPACAAGETCEGTGSSARCVSGDVDAGGSTDLGMTGTDAGAIVDVVTPVDQGVPADTGTAIDTGTPVDTGAPIDVAPIPDVVADDRPVISDLGSPVDVPVVADVVDAGASDAPAPIACGMAGQACCNGRACYGGGYCSGGVCAAPSARDTDECTRPTDCTAGRTCGGIYTCGGGADAGVSDAGSPHTRGCFLCGTPPGAGAFDAPCANATACASGLCSGGHCTEACVYGDAGDASCAGHGASYRCLNTFFAVTSSGPITTLGVCAKTCARQGDCGADSACVPRLNYFADRMDFACTVPSASLTGNPGDACNPSGTTTCRNILCVATTATTGYCTAPCAIDADCPAAAPVCDAITFSRPSGLGQAGRACRPR